MESGTLTGRWWNREKEKGAAKIIWDKNEPHRNWASLSAGCYLLRSNVTDWSDEELWKAYIQLSLFCTQISM